jgi:hypothetical protein
MKSLNENKHLFILKDIQEARLNCDTHTVCLSLDLIQLHQLSKK